MKEAVARIYSKKTRLGAEYYTNQHGIQFYTGNFLDGTLASKKGKSYEKRN